MAHWSSISLPTSVDRTTGILTSALGAAYIAPVEIRESRDKLIRYFNSRMFPPSFSACSTNLGHHCVVATKQRTFLQLRIPWAGTNASEVSTIWLPKAAATKPLQ